MDLGCSRVKKQLGFSSFARGGLVKKDAVIESFEALQQLLNIENFSIRNMLKLSIGCAAARSTILELDNSPPVPKKTILVGSSCFGGIQCLLECDFARCRLRGNQRGSAANGSEGDEVPDW